MMNISDDEQSVYDLYIDSIVTGLEQYCIKEVTMMMDYSSNKL